MPTVPHMHLPFPSRCTTPRCVRKPFSLNMTHTFKNLIPSLLSSSITGRAEHFFSASIQQCFTAYRCWTCTTYRSRTTSHQNTATNSSTADPAAVYDRAANNNRTFPTMPLSSMSTLATASYGSMALSVVSMAVPSLLRLRCVRSC